MKKLIIQDIKQRIWQAAGHDLARVQRAIADVGDNDNSEKFWRKVLRKVKPSKAKPVLPAEYYERYRKAYRDYQAREFPRWHAAGHTLDPDMPNTATGNGLTEFIVKFLNWSGHRATRITTEGRVLPDGKRIPTQTRKGTADISATINGKAVMLEVKAGRDRPSPAQLKEQARERKAGGVYEFIHNVQEFFDWYDRFVIFEAPK